MFVIKLINTVILYVHNISCRYDTNTAVILYMYVVTAKHICLTFSVSFIVIS